MKRIKRWSELFSFMLVDDHSDTLCKLGEAAEYEESVEASLDADELTLVTEACELKYEL